MILNASVGKRKATPSEVYRSTFVEGVSSSFGSDSERLCRKAQRDTYSEVYRSAFVEGFGVIPNASVGKRNVTLFNAFHGC